MESGGDGEKSAFRIIGDADVFDELKAMKEKQTKKRKPNPVFIIDSFKILLSGMKVLLKIHENYYVIRFFWKWIV